MTSEPNYYDVLRVKPAASQQEISRAYRALMRTHHPDLDGGAAEGAELLRGELLHIMQAFSVLRDPAQRAAYDRRRAGTSTRTNGQDARAVVIPVRKVPNPAHRPTASIRITPVHWESGPWA
jgi:DnaJ-class molecular chaperone